MIHDRLRHLEEQQRQHFEQMQQMSSFQGESRHEAAAVARKAAEDAIRKECDLLREDIGGRAASVAQEAAASIARHEASGAAREAATAATQQLKESILAAQGEALRSAA